MTFWRVETMTDCSVGYIKKKVTVIKLEFFFTTVSPRRNLLTSSNSKKEIIGKKSGIIVLSLPFK